MKKEISIEKFTFESAFDGQVLQAVAYRPKKPKAILQLVHGMCEHMGRYEEMMAFFADNGYLVCGYDQRGHGDSVSSNDDLGFFGDNTAKGIVEDAVQFSRLMKEKYPKIPLYLYGHSMGSMVVRCYLQDHDTEIDKLIVSGSPNRNLLAGVAVLLAKFTKTVKNNRHRSGFLKKLSLGSAEKSFPADGKLGWLTRDKEVVEKYASDEKCNFTFTVNGFENLFSLLQNTYDKDLYDVKNPALPIRFVAGSEDPIIGGEDKWLSGHAFLREVGYTSVSGKLYHGMRHEPHNEIGKEEVFNDILTFLER